MVLVISWLLWRPVAGIVALFALANARRYTIREAPFWSVGYTTFIGAVYGVAAALIVALSIALSLHSWYGIALYVFVGFSAAGYIGYGWASHEERRVLTHGAASIAYLIAIGLYLAGRALLPQG